MKKRLLLIGGGGHCHSVLDSVLSLNVYDEIGIVDYTDTSVAGIPIVGKDEDLPRLKEVGWNEAFITVGSIGNTELRHRLYQMVVGFGFVLPAIIDPSAVIARDAVVEKGCFIGKGVILNTGCKVGECSIINTGAVIEHECIIREFVHVSPGTVLCGQVTIGNDTHIGAGSVIRQQLNIGNHSLIGMGSVVVNNIPDNVKACGNPCKVVK